jgi:hypothetical protein
MLPHPAFIDWDGVWWAFAWLSSFWSLPPK